MQRMCVLKIIDAREPEFGGPMTQGERQLDKRVLSLMSLPFITIIVYCRIMYNSNFLTDTDSPTFSLSQCLLICFFTFQIYYIPIEPITIVNRNTSHIAIKHVYLQEIFGFDTMSGKKFKFRTKVHGNIRKQVRCQK